MPNEFDIPELDSLVDAIASRIAGRIPQATLPDIFSGSRLRIEGVEFTQSTQHHGVAGQGGWEPDNSVPLVAYKDLVVRVYPSVQRGAIGPDTLTGRFVTGELVLSIGDRVVYRTGPTRRSGTRVGAVRHLSRTLWDEEITALVGGGSGPVAVELEPLIINGAVNFRVPAYYCKRGRVHASVRIWPVDETPVGNHAASRSRYLQFLDVRAPRVCLVRVNWVDSGGTTFSPTDEEMLGSLNLATRMLPFPYFQTTILGVEKTKKGAFAEKAKEAGGCNPAWKDLLRDLDDVRVWTRLFGLGDIVYGLVPRDAIPAGAGSINSGCAIVSGAGFVSDGMTLAHEIGHLYTCDHVFVAGASNNDPDYPAYGWKRSIGEVGVDTGTTPPTVYDPDEAIDVMAYQSSAREPQWISPYTYRKILDNRDLWDNAVIDPSRVRPVLVLSLRLHRVVEGSAYVDIRRAAVVEAPGPLPPRPEGAISPVSMDLLDGEGRILATHHCFWRPGYGGGDCGCGPAVSWEREPWLDLTEVVEWPEGVSRVAFHRGRENLYVLDVGRPPEVRIEGPERTDEHLTVYVRAQHPRDRVSVTVLFSNDDGQTWQPVAFDPPEERVQISREHLQGGPSCRFRAVATAELASAVADTPSFDLPPVPRRILLDVPRGDCPVAPGAVHLSAVIDHRGLGAPAPDEIRWSSDVVGDLGAGYGIAPDLPAGEHTVTVTAPDGLGGTLSERAIIVVGGRSR
jgi:hypothetical protein